MIWHLVATFSAGLGAAGIAFLLRSISRQKLPKWIIPGFAGLGMLGYQIYFEYNWFDHQSSRQPEGSVVTSSQQGEVFWRPWTFFYPMTTVFTVVDTNNLQVRNLDGLTLVEFIEYRFEKKYIDVVTHQRYVMNCTEAQRIAVSDEQQVLSKQPQLVERDSPLFVAVCQSSN
ncbi:MAG: hypothetical protein KAY87_03330 [Thiopseudomonas sp.]|jgi:hypothetical protein|uniref:hypothetical protein n=1 Tax=Denitrificimonas caeni TaxID=521720 RepID=UPI0003B5DC90|nr:hypothetical protein [Denitrificimonas caeni]MBP8008141.1 hypothetical protein [Thiopseudomonas sp.]HAB91828.1 hypothetical protein [Pseudomonas sp.]HHX05076.1 hypothetical protein [Pseudomonas sp.]